MQNRLFLLMLSPVISKDQEQGSDNQNCNESENKKEYLHRYIPKYGTSPKMLTYEAKLTNESPKKVAHAFQWGLFDFIIARTRSPILS